jgi:hypothetical protein
MKKYHILAMILASLIICNFANPASASRDDQTGDCLASGMCKD